MVQVFIDDQEMVAHSFQLRMSGDAHGALHLGPTVEAEARS
ncbi:MAG: hypothetical protein ACRDRZ_18930 [Pseudonocardiaceae bacterium]